jgi:aryl-alcohol dehydrogenase-like predicted oxidoreductase
MVRLIEQGKVQLGGVSNFDVPLLEPCERIRQVDSLQPPFSLIHRQAAEREIPWCAEHKTGVICYSPMQSGLLTDTFTREFLAKLAPDDWRRRSPDFQEPNLESQSCAAGCPPNRTKTPYHSICRGDRMDDCLACGHWSDRGCSFAPAG